MLRFVRAPDGALAFDVRGKLPGRGAWTQPNPACVRKAIDKGGFSRSFEAPVLVQMNEMVAQVEEVLRTTAMQSLGLAQRSQHLVAGRTEVIDAVLRKPGRFIVVLADDLASRSAEDLTTKVEGAAAVVRVLSKADLGQALGRRATGVIAVNKTPGTERLRHDLVRLARFTGGAVDASLLPKWRAEERAASNGNDFEVDPDEKEAQSASCRDDKQGVQAPSLPGAQRSE